MRLTLRDGIATLLFAVIVIPYALLVFVGGFSFDDGGGGKVGILDPTGMSALALIVGAVAAYIGGWVVLQETEGLRYLTGGLGVAALLLGGVTLVGENLFNADVWYGLLAAFMGALFLLWGIATSRHAGLVGGEAPPAPHPA